MHGGWESLKLESEKDTEDTTELEYNLTKWVWLTVEKMRKNNVSRKNGTHTPKLQDRNIYEIYTVVYSPHWINGLGIMEN